VKSGSLEPSPQDTEMTGASFPAEALSTSVTVESTKSAESIKNRRLSRLRLRCGPTGGREQDEDKQGDRFAHGRESLTPVTCLRA